MVIYMDNIIKSLEKNLFNIIRTVIVFLIYYYLPTIFALIIKSFGIKINYNMAIVYSLLISALIAIILIIIYWNDLVREFKTYFKNFSTNIDCGVRYWFIGLIIMCVSNLILNFIIGSGGPENEQSVQEMINSLPLVSLLYAGVVAPINEELVFRKSLRDVFSNKWAFAIASFLVFGYAHVSGTEGLQLLYIIPYGALGGAFALAYDESNTVFTSMFMHMFHNIVLTLISILFII